MVRTKKAQKTNLLLLKSSNQHSRTTSLKINRCQGWARQNSGPLLIWVKHQKGKKIIARWGYRRLIRHLYGLSLARKKLQIIPESGSSLSNLQKASYAQSWMKVSLQRQRLRCILLVQGLKKMLGYRSLRKKKPLVFLKRQLVQILENQTNWSSL